jgi:hypothetical protein
MAKRANHTADQPPLARLMTPPSPTSLPAPTPPDQDRLLSRSDRAKYNQLAADEEDLGDIACTQPLGLYTRGRVTAAPSPHR